MSDNSKKTTDKNLELDSDKDKDKFDQVNIYKFDKINFKEVDVNVYTLKINSKI
jgi:hypothetical protein